MTRWVIENHPVYHKRVVMYSEDVILKIKKLAEYAKALPCGMNNCNCELCNDEVTENGLYCMEKRINQILKLIESEV